MGAFKIFSRFAELLDINVARGAAAWLRLNADGTVTERNASDTLADLGGITQAAADPRYGAYGIMRNLADIDITTGSLIPISGMSLPVEANSVYEMSGCLNVFATGGSPTTNRVAFRIATTGTFVAGGVFGPSSNGGFFPQTPNVVATTSFTDFSNVDRASPIFGTFITGSAGTLTLNGWKIQGSGTPRLLANSILILRKIA